MKTPKTLRYFYYRFVRLHGRPHEIAMGMAIGLAVGLTPTMGVQMPIAVAIAAVLGQSKIAAALGVWISNPVTAPVVYGTTYTLGALILGYPLHPPEGLMRAMTNLHSLTSGILWPMLLGGAVLTVPIAVTGYWLTYQAVVAYRLRLRHRRANRMHKWKWNPQTGWHRENLASRKQAGGDP